MPTVLVALLLVAGGAAAADTPRALQSEMVKVEKEFYDLYNRLNTEHQYDMVCKMEQATGSRFATRVCQPRYALTAKEESATARMQAATSAGQSAGPANTQVPNVGNSNAGGAAVAHVSKEEGFRQNVLAVLEKSPELRVLAEKRDDLQARYEAAAKAAGQATR